MPYDIALLGAAARELATGFGRSCWPNRYAVDAFGRPHVYDDSRSRRQLTWSPQVGSFQEVIGEAARWYREPALSAPPGR